MSQHEGKHHFKRGEVKCSKCGILKYVLERFYAWIYRFNSCKHEPHQIGLNLKFGKPDWQCGCGHYLTQEEWEARGMQSPGEAKIAKETEPWVTP